MSNLLLPVPPSVYYLEPELMFPAPRQAHLTLTTRVFRVLLWNLFIGTFLVLLFFARRDLNGWNALLKRGQVIQATIISKYTTPVKNDDVEYHVAYRFPVERTHCSDETLVSASHYNEIKKGDHLPVTYLPGSNGEIWQLGIVTAERRAERRGVWIGWTITATGLLGATLACLTISWKNQLLLLQNGIAKTGSITDIQPIKNSNPYSEPGHYTIVYHYKVGKRVLVDTIRVTQETAEQYKKRGPFLSVLYDSQNPKRSRAYSKITAARLDSVDID